VFDLKAWFAGFRGAAEPATSYERGAQALRRGRWVEALVAFDLALGTASSDAERAAACNKRGVALMALERRGEALEAFCAALEVDERHAAALVNLGNLLLEDGCVYDAIDYYEAALRSDEKYAPAYQNLGVAYKRLGRPGAAVRHLRKAVRLETSRSPERA